MSDTRIYEICDYLKQSPVTENITETARKIERVVQDNVYKAIEDFCRELPLHMSKLTLERQRSKMIKITYPVILVFGIIGNLFSFLVMAKIFKRSKKFHKFAFSLAVLSLTDLGMSFSFNFN